MSSTTGLSTICPLSKGLHQVFLAISICHVSSRTGNQPKRLKALNLWKMMKSPMNSLLFYPPPVPPCLESSLWTVRTSLRAPSTHSDNSNNCAAFSCPHSFGGAILTTLRNGKPFAATFNLTIFKGVRRITSATLWGHFRKAAVIFRLPEPRRNFMYRIVNTWVATQSWHRILSSFSVFASLGYMKHPLFLT